MAIHKHLSTLAKEAIDEYLQIARYCVGNEKPEGGIFGFAASLLLLCAVNALGAYLRNEEVVIDGNTQRITKREPFRVLNHQLLNQNLSMTQIKRIEQAYRNPLTHTALLEAGVGLTAGQLPTASPFQFKDDMIWISVPALLEAVHIAWNKVDPQKMKRAIDTFQLGHHRGGTARRA